jgi:hypothetical protein
VTEPKIWRSLVRRERIKCKISPARVLLDSFTHRTNRARGTPDEAVHHRFPRGAVDEIAPAKDIYECEESDLVVERHFSDPPIESGGEGPR